MNQRVLFVGLGVVGASIFSSCSVTRPKGDPLQPYSDRMGEYFSVPALPPAPKETAPVTPSASTKKGNPTPVKPVKPDPDASTQAPAGGNTAQNLEKRELAGEAVQARYNFLFRQDYDTYRKSSFLPNVDDAVNLERRKMLRNEIMSKLMVVIDNHFYSFEAQLTGGRAWTGLASNLAILGLNAAGAVVGGAEIKAILAATAAGVQGTELSIEKRMFQEQGPYLIVSYMRANRMECKTRIRKRMFLDDSQYSLDDGLSDMVDYFNSGTVISALNVAMADAENRKKDSVREMQAVYDDLLDNSTTAQFLATHQLQIVKQAKSFSDFVIDYNAGGNNYFSASDSLKFLGGDLRPVADAFSKSDDVSKKIQSNFESFVKEPADVTSRSPLEMTGFLSDGNSVVCSRKIFYGDDKSVTDVYTLKRNEEGKWMVCKFKRGDRDVSTVLKVEKEEESQ